MKIKKSPPPPWRFLFSHPAHFIACGLGSGLSPFAPGTAGTLLAWALYPLIRPVFGVEDLAFAIFLLAAFAYGVLACGRTGRDLGIIDHGAIVWDEIVPSGWCCSALTAAMATGRLSVVSLFRYPQTASRFSTRG